MSNKMVHLLVGNGVCEMAIALLWNSHYLGDRSIQSCEVIGIECQNFVCS